MIVIKTHPLTRINDSFIRTDQIDASPVARDISHPLVDTPPNIKISRYASNFYSKIALDIVTETVFDYPYPYITEKTLRPINCKRMFIVVGAPYTLSLLHSKGIKTFPDIIDESYDSIEDAEERFLSVVESIEQFCRLDLQKIKKYYQDNVDKFSHNWNTLKSLPWLDAQKIRKGL